MIAKKYKLPIKEFLAKRSKLFFKSEFFGIRADRNELKFSRFGVVISKKVFDKAAHRNRIKRTIFELIKKEKFYLEPGLDVLVTVLPGRQKKLDKIFLEELKNDLLKALGKVNF